LDYKSISAFVLSGRKDNDKNNKTRESIVGAIINGKIPEEYFRLSRLWNALRLAISRFTENLSSGTPIATQSLIHRGGRKYNYDFTVNINGTEHNVELKYNAEKVSDTPQFASPMNPSQYLESSYELFYYTNYLPRLANEFGLEMPSLERYLKEIHTNAPKCVAAFQELYYKGCQKSSKFTNDPEHLRFYETAKRIDEESRRAFIAENGLNIELLTAYLQKSQEGKIYMLYSRGTFHLYRSCVSDYTLVSYRKDPEKFRYVVKNASGCEFDVLLRWKNGNGIAYPAFQIS
jgi:hypothetical protein